MCSIALALGIVGTAVSAAGSIAQGKQQEAMANAQAAAQEQQALADARAAEFEAMQESRKQSLLQANARAQVGASGVGFAGSPGAVLTANAGQGQLDIEAIRYGSRLRQNNMKDQAAITRFGGKQAKTAGYINAGSALVSGISNMYDPKRAAKLTNTFAAGNGLY